MSVDQFAAQRRAARTAATICRAVTNERALVNRWSDGTQPGILDNFLCRVDREDLAGAAIVLTVALLDVVDRKIIFEDSDDLLHFLLEIALPRGDAA
jgi:hypothetical protein